MRKNKKMEVSVIQISDQEEFVKDQGLKQKRICWQKFKKYALPSKNKVNSCITKFLVLFFLSSTFYGVLKEKTLPGSEIFAIFSLIVSSVALGKCFQLMKMPALVGMLMAGLLFRNLDIIPFYHHISKQTTVVIRGIALCYILLRAGFALEETRLKNFKSVVMRLTFLPCLAEVVCMGLLSHLFLDLPWIFSFMLGFIISAVSPAVVIPHVLHLKNKGYGTNKGIPTVIISATSFDDILAISGFTICFSIAFSQENLLWTVIKGPLEPMVGLAFGAVVGVIIWHFPNANNSKGTLIYYNILLVSLASLTAIFLSSRFHIPSAGPIACISLAFVAAMKWKKDSYQMRSVDSVTCLIWHIIEPFLFSLIGTEVSLENVQSDAGYAALTIFCAVIMRIIIAGFVSYGENFDIKEKIFICISWLPKATVQAAIGSQVLDHARFYGKEEKFLYYGMKILNVSVLSIILTAPLGAFLMKILGPILLTRERETATLTTETILVHQEIGGSKTDEPETSNKELLSDYGSCSLLPALVSKHRKRRSF